MSDTAAIDYLLLAELLVILHALFVVFVVLGGLLVWRWRWLAWLHLPAILWAIILESFGLICPLTPLENHWRMLAGDAGVYETTFIQQYLLPLLYPAGLTAQIQWLLAAGVFLLNLLIYAGLYWYWRQQPRTSWQ